ncbi:hypothetical protein F5884DRAFT_899440 [Xylogone sp. PMI_703]|nr:hypothetical protein F5884DRAFT_899440 [Xylogone sp. PMI_703]
MASRFAIPYAYDPQMYQSDRVTLSRTASQRAKLQAISSSDASKKVAADSKHETGVEAQTKAHRKNLVFADPVAFRYLEEDPSIVVVQPHDRLPGYELYIVEQWACSRKHPTFIIATYTGDMAHFVEVGVLGVPADESLWSQRLRVYFEAISQYHARPKDTPLGMLMVTNLSSFPSALTVILVPGGDVRKHREDFIVNENLKRLGCSGRSGISLAPPAGATQAKFFQLYKTTDRRTLYEAVIELVKLCQIALMMFGKLEQEYADGLLCDVTEKAITDWWSEIGSEYYNMEPTDGILGPTTVAGLLGMLMGARNRLNYYGAPVSKDAFDVVSLKRGISYFQKSQKLERTRRLDRHTLARLHRVTAKAAAGEGWAMPKAVKSTVAELSSKGGEMVMGMVGGRDKAGIGDIETVDIDKFVSLIHGERGKWLWYGKSKRGGTGEGHGRTSSDFGTLSWSKIDQGGYIWSNRTDSMIQEDDQEPRRSVEISSAVYDNRPPWSATNITESANDRDRDRELRKTVFKSVTDKMNDARSGFGRIKDAVGLRGHGSKHSKDDTVDVEGRASYFSSTPTLSPSVISGHPGTPPAVSKVFTWKTKPGEYQNGEPLEKVTGTEASTRELDSPKESPVITAATEDVEKEDETDAKWIAQAKKIRQDLMDRDISANVSVIGEECDLEGPVLEAARSSNNFDVLLYRRSSIAASPTRDRHRRNESYWPRHMSFSEAEDAVLTWKSLGIEGEKKEDSDTWAAFEMQKYISEDMKHLYEKVLYLQNDISPWVECKVNDIDVLDNLGARDQEEFQSILLRVAEAYQEIKQASEDVLAEERTHTSAKIKDIEVLGAKLEYEVNALYSKVLDVEDAVAQFNRQVDDLEARADELEIELHTESWVHWIVRSITGFGSPPHPIKQRS